MKKLALAAFALLILPVESVALASTLHLGPADFRVLNASGSAIIGHSRYELSRSREGLLIGRGEAHFQNGEYDIEYDTLHSQGPGKAPRMLTFEHRFYNADGSLQRDDVADFRTGKVSCTRYEQGVAHTASAILNLPPNSYGGSAVVLPLQEYLAEGGRGPLKYNAVNCIPGPRLLAVVAYPHQPARWSHYPGLTVEVDVKPDLGWLNLVVGRFLPALRAWFAPSKEWLFVGGRFSRFYRGPQIILVRQAPMLVGGAGKPPVAQSPLAAQQRMPAR